MAYQEHLTNFQLLLIILTWTISIQKQNQLLYLFTVTMPAINAYHELLVDKAQPVTVYPRGHTVWVAGEGQ